MITSDQLSIVIPSYRRGGIMLQTIERLLAAPARPGEILVVDQTEQHPADVQAELDRLSDQGRIRRLVLAPPSIPRAMNTGLLAARGRVVLFLDDDIEPSEQLVAIHARHHGGNYAAVCGQVLQPGQEAEHANRCAARSGELTADLDFAFNGTQPAEIRNVMAGNLSVDRDAALAVGGFDECFIGSAYRFETDFARRLNASGYRIQFAPEASLRHLRLSSGGTRSAGDHLRHPSPLHSVGDYYFALRHGQGLGRVRYLARRVFQECINRFYARHPWLMPRKLISEYRAFRMARGLMKDGPQLIGRGMARDA